MNTLQIRVNGQKQRLDVEPDTPLLYALRNELNLHGPRFGCGKGQCGACSVIIDGQVVRSCVTPVTAVGAREVTTLEGLGSSDQPSPVQQAFIETQAAQCGYCINGMVVAATALLLRQRQPSEGEIRAALAGHLCRCGTHTRIIKAVQRAAELSA